MEIHSQKCKLPQWSEGLFSPETKGKIRLLFASLLFTTRRRIKILMEKTGRVWWDHEELYSTRQRLEVHAIPSRNDHSGIKTFTSSHPVVRIFVVSIGTPVHTYICDQVNNLNTHPLTHTDMSAQINTTTSICTQWPQARNHAYITRLTARTPSHCGTWFMHIEKHTEHKCQQTDTNTLEMRNLLYSFGLKSVNSGMVNFENNIMWMRRECLYNHNPFTPTQFSTQFTIIPARQPNSGLRLWMYAIMFPHQHTSQLTHSHTYSSYIRYTPHTHTHIHRQGSNYDPGLQFVKKLECKK